MAKRKKRRSTKYVHVTRISWDLVDELQDEGLAEGEYILLEFSNSDRNRVLGPYSCDQINRVHAFVMAMWKKKGYVITFGSSSPGNDDDIAM